MNKRYIRILSIFVLLFQIVCPLATHVEAYDGANKQPEVCGWPSEMMSQYFNFQKEAKTILRQSQLAERRSAVSMWNGWLFTSWVLELPSALDFVASDVLWKTKSTISTAATSVVLMMMISASVLQSNTEWFAILFKDRPIVRDYKQMLDIETQLFDVAYYWSNKMDLRLRVEWDDFYNKFNDLIKKYQKSGLLETTTSELGSESMADMLTELIDMNTAMKHFILFLGRPWTKALENYNWCFWNSTKENCTSINAVIRFSKKAMDTLKEDYSGLWTFWACNLYASNFKNTIAKSFNNNTASVNASFQDVRDAMKRLKWALVNDYDDIGDWDMHISKNGVNCNMSEYEMAQLKAYWWSDWECGKGIDMSVAMPKISEYARNKKAQNNQRSNNANMIKNAAATTWPEWASSSKVTGGYEVVIAKLENETNNDKRRQFWFQTYGWDGYNPEFIYDMVHDMDTIFSEVMMEYSQSQQNAMAWDFAYQLRKIKWLIDQVNATMNSATLLQNILQEIANYQCTN